MPEIWPNSVFSIPVCFVSVKKWNDAYETESTCSALSRLTTSTHWPYYFNVYVNVYGVLHFYDKCVVLFSWMESVQFFFIVFVYIFNGVGDPIIKRRELTSVCSTLPVFYEWPKPGPTFPSTFQWYHLFLLAMGWEVIVSFVDIDIILHSFNPSTNLLYH